MKSTTKILLYSFCFLAVLSCRKEKSFTVKVYNPVTGEGYEGYDIQIVEGTSTVPCLGCPSESNVIFFGTTNADGEVLVTERFHKDYSYSVHVSNSNNVDFCYNNAYHEGYNTGGMKINLRMSKIEGSTAYLELVPCAELKLKVNNVNCQGASDNFKLFHYGSEVGFIDGLGGQPIKEGEGCYTYDQNYLAKVPIGERYYKWEVTRSGTTNTYYDTIYLSEGEQRIYEINY